MISVGSRNGRKGLGLGLEMEETELEEGEACCYQNNNDDSTIDPDVALAYIGEKLEDVLGHFQKDFEGGVSAENLGAKFGGYGSFLPTYQRSPAWPHPRTPPKSYNHNVSISPNNLHMEGGHQNSVISASASHSARDGLASSSISSLPPLKGPSVNDKLKREASKSSARCGEESTSNGGVVNKSSDPKTLKLRIKVGSDNLSTRKNAEIYSGLGLDVSPSSSLEVSPTDSEGFFHEPQDAADESPTSILQIMTSFPLHGCKLLSPLPNELMCLTEEEKHWGDSGFGPHKGSQEMTCVNGSNSDKFDRKLLAEKKPKPSEKKSVSVESMNGNYNDARSGNGVLMNKEIDMDSLACEELVSSALSLPLLSDSNSKAIDFTKGNARMDKICTVAINGGVRDEFFSDVAKEESLEPVFTNENSLMEKPYRKDHLAGKVCENKKENSDDDSVYPMKKGYLIGEQTDISATSDSDVSKGRNPLKAESLDPPKLKASHKAMCLEKDGKLAAEKEMSSSGGRKKSKGSRSQGTLSAEVSKGSLKNDSSSVAKNRKSTYENGYVSKNNVEDFKKDNGKARERYRDFFGELDLEQEDSEMALEEKPSGSKLKESAILEKCTSEVNCVSKERLNGKRSQKPSSSVYPRVGSHGPVSDTAATVNTDNENWVCCDKCQLWRLLPPGTNLDSLPEKWLCSMLSWLPGMNRCGIPEEETTNALISHYYVPAPASLTSQHHPFGIPSGVSSADALHFDQSHQYLASQALPAGGKKKHGSKDVPNETKQDGPTQSSNSMKKNPKTLVKNRSFNGVKQSPAMNGVEIQDSGQSSSLVVEKHKQKQKEKSKLDGKFVDGGDTQLPKIRKKRETDQDCSRASKKTKTNGLPYTNEDRASERGGTVVKVGRSSSRGLSASVSGKDGRKYSDRPKDLKHDSKGSARFDHMGKFDEGEVGKKRKLNERQDAQTYRESLTSTGDHLQESMNYVEETSESYHRKEKKAKVSKSGGEETCASKGSGGTDKKFSSMKEEQLGSLDAIDSSKRDMGSLQASVTATSSSSKVSGSHKTKANLLEVKGSPVESVSSSPMRISNPDKFTSVRRNLRGIDDSQNAGYFALSSPKKGSDGEEDRVSYRSGTARKDEAPVATHQGSLGASVLDFQERDLGQASANKGKAEILPPHEFGTRDVIDGDADASGHGVQGHSKPETSNQGHNEERWNDNQCHANGSRTRKSGKGSSSRSKDKSRSSRSEFDKVILKGPDSSNEYVDRTLYEEKSKTERNKSQEKLLVSSDKVQNNSASKKEASGKLLSDTGRRESQSKHGHTDGSDVGLDAISSQDLKQKLPVDRDSERHSKRSSSDKTDRVDVSGRGKSHSLPPSGRGQSEAARLPQPIPGSQKENAGNALSANAFEGNDAAKAPNQSKKSENQNGNQPMNTRHPTPNRHRIRDHDAPSPIRRDSSSQAATNAFKEAKDLKHLADRLADRMKNTGSNLESTGLYFQAALKFLHGASLLESCNSESSKHGDMIQSRAMYSSTAKLCEFCAHEYEKSKEMAAAALAYKCAEVAYLKVIYSSNTSASKDQHELQTALQIVPTGESPSSSASDLDNLNNPTIADKAPLNKGVGSPHVAGNHVIAAQNRPKFVRLLNFAQDVNFAMEASRRSRSAFAASNVRLEEGNHREGISSVRKALDFNFQDVDGLLRLVRLAMEAISR